MTWQITLDLLFRPGYDWPMASLNPLLSAQGNNIHTQANESKKRVWGCVGVCGGEAVAAKLASQQCESRI